jgi:chorismate--pyruvate lyase
MSRLGFHWKASPSVAGAPKKLQPWLADPGSLTARIKANCREFHVQVIREGYARPFADEYGLIGLPADRYAWVREVLLHADNNPVVYAHSLLAPQDLACTWHMARAIGSRPLGAALFADPRIRRGPLQVARLSMDHPLHRHAVAAIGHALPLLWARRSRFTRMSRPLLVSEVFLPGIERLAP